MIKKELTGMRLVFFSQILRLITEVLFAASYVLSLSGGLTLKSVVQEGLADIGSFMYVMALDMLVLFFSIASVIVYIIGLIILSRYERKFMPAIFTLILGYGTAFITYLPVAEMLSDVIPVFNDVMLMVTTLTVMEGIMRLAYRMNDEKLYDFGDLLVKICAAGYVVNMLCSTCTLIFATSYSYDDISTVFSSASIIIELAINIMFFILVVRAVKLLKRTIKDAESTPSEPEEVGAETASA